MKTKNLLMALFTAVMVIASTFVAIAPVKGLVTVVYADPAFVDGTTMPVGTIFTVTVYIENAVEMVQWSLSVKVDPTALEVMGVSAPTGKNYIIDDYATWVNDKYFTSFSTAFVGGTVDKTAGMITDASQAILSWPDLVPLGVGGFDGSVDPITMGKAKLCQIGFKTKSQTAYSPIDLYNVKIFDTATSPIPHYVTEPDITVKDSSYNKPQPMPPVAEFTVSTTTPFVNDIVTFDASASYDPDGTIAKYDWNFGDGATATGMMATHAYTAVGAYTVTLTVTDNSGLKGSATATIAVTLPPVEIVPNLVRKSAWPQHHHFVVDKFDTINVLYAKAGNPSTIDYLVKARFTIYDARDGTILGTIETPETVLPAGEMLDVQVNFDVNQFPELAKAYVKAELLYLYGTWAVGAKVKWFSFAIIW